MNCLFIIILEEVAALQITLPTAPTTHSIPHLAIQAIATPVAQEGCSTTPTTTVTTILTRVAAQVTHLSSSKPRTVLIRKQHDRLLPPPELILVPVLLLRQVAGRV
uniref:Uncharacterized protein n=1 Tax=Cacopsylla melanoneura TaxID=428564 RepID=A0A8D8QEF6_9HEMI